jgi:hypothetical protein
MDLLELTVDDATRPSRSAAAKLAMARLSSGQMPSIGCPQCGIVGHPGVNAPIIGREGLLRLAAWAEGLRARGPGKAGRRGRCERGHLR